MCIVRQMAGVHMCGRLLRPQFGARLTAILRLLRLVPDVARRGVLSLAVDQQFGGPKSKDKYEQ